MVGEDPRGRAGRSAPLVLPEWLEAGLAGGLTVAAVSWCFDMASGDPYRTPAALGTLLLSGAGVTEPLAGAAAIYHMFHFVVWVLLGLLGERLMRRAEDDPSLRWLPGAALACLVAALGVAQIALPEARPSHAPLWLAGLAGLAVMSGFLLWRHPGVRGRSGSGRPPGPDAAP